MKNTIQLYTDDSKTVKGYPITSPDRVLYGDGKSIKDKLKKTVKFDVVGEGETTPPIEGELDKIKESVDSITEQLDNKTNKAETQNIQQQVNNLVLGAVGEGNNAEVIQARGNEAVINDRFNNIENGKLINNLSFSKFSQRDNIIDYSRAIYKKKIEGYNTDTGEAIYSNDENTIVVELSIKPYCGTITLPIYEHVPGQAMLCMVSDKAVKNLTYSNLKNDSYDWLTIMENTYVIDCAKLYSYGVDTMSKKITSILVALNKTNNYAYRENGVVIQSKALVDRSLSTYPFTTTSTLIKCDRNYRCLQHAIKDINITTNHLDWRFYVRFVVVGEDISVHIASVETKNTVANATGIPIKKGLQKVQLNQQLDSGCTGYIIIDTSMIDTTLKLWEWYELDYETSGISPKCINLPLNIKNYDNDIVILNDKLNKIENGKNINNLSFSKFNKTDVDIIDYKTALYNKKITGYDASTFLPIYGNNIGSIVITLPLTLYSGTIKIPKYNANGQAMLLCASGKVFKNFTYSNLNNDDTLAWLTVTDNYFEINLSKLYSYCWSTFSNKVVTEIIITMDKNNSFVYRKNGIVLSGNESLVDQVINAFPFATSATLIKNGRNYRSLIKAIKDIKIYTNDLTHKFYIRFLTVGANNVGLHLATVEKGDTVLNIPNIEIKSGIQKVDFTVQNSSGYSGYMLIDTSLIDTDLSAWGWYELDYETSGLSSSILTKPTESTESTVVDTKEYKIIIPPKMYGVSDKEVALYLDNITSLKLDNYIIRKVSGTGDLKSRNRIIYNINTAGWADKTKLELYTDNGDKVKDLEIPFKIVGKSANSGVTKKCLFIGDSFIANGSITSELLNLFSNDVMNIELLGTKGSGTNKHEGRSGWSSYDYVTTSSFNDSTNAFLNNGSFDFNHYITQNSIDTPDWVFLQVGINDTWRPMNGTTTVQNLQTIINSIKAFNRNIKVGIALVCPPYLGEYGLNNSYDHLKRIKINETVISTFKNKESEGIFIVPINVNLDTIYNFPMGTTTINSRNSGTIQKCTDDTHPANIGYYQISDSYYCFMKCN